jgi:hypothetical protein
MGISGHFCEITISHKSFNVNIIFFIIMVAISLNDPLFHYCILHNDIYLEMSLLIVISIMASIYALNG